MIKHHNTIKIILYFALLVRILALVIVFILSDYYPTKGFIGNSSINDDYRYERGAELYAAKANSVFDTDAFTDVFDSMSDWTGHMLDQPFSSTPFWYWFCCVLVFLTNTVVSIKLCNIFFSVAAIFFIYNITEVSYGKNEAIIASLLMSFLPYQVFFPCFSYKDTFVMMCTFALIWKAIKFQLHTFKTHETITVLIIFFLLLLTRSGVTVILALLLAFYLFLEYGRLRFKRSIIKWIPLLFVLCVLILLRFGSTILYKFEVYNSYSNLEGLGFGRFVKIVSISQIWKLPFTVIFAAMQPFNISLQPGSWADIISVANIIMIPIGIGSLLFIISREKKKTIHYIMLLFFLISAISSILIFRQLFAVQPISIIMFSVWLVHSVEKEHMKNI